MTRWEIALRQLLPQGSLFDEMDPDSEIAKLMRGPTHELERIDGRARDLVAEMDPRTATETLPEWERAYGLPDARVPVLPATVPGRRAAIALKVVMQGAQNEAAYRALIEACGWELLAVLKAWTRKPANCRSFSNVPLNGLIWALTVEFRVGNEDVDALPFADLTTVLQYTMQSHAKALVAYGP